MSNLPQRTFLMRNVHDDAPVLLRTRWALSYLRGPLTLGGDRQADRDRCRRVRGRATAAPRPPRRACDAAARAVPRRRQRPVVPAGVHEQFLAGCGRPGRRRTSRASAPACARTSSTRRPAWTPGKTGTTWRRSTARRPGLGSGRGLQRRGRSELRDAPAADATFRRRAGQRARGEGTRAWAKALEDHVYRTSSLTVLSLPGAQADVPRRAAPKASSAPTWRWRCARSATRPSTRCAGSTRAKLAALEDRERAGRAEARAREGRRPASETMSSALSAWAAACSARCSAARRGSAFGKASSAARSVGRIGKERTDVAHAEADLTALREQHRRAEGGARGRGRARSSRSSTRPRSPIETVRRQAAQVRHRRRATWRSSGGPLDVESPARATRVTAMDDLISRLTKDLGVTQGPGRGRPRGAAARRPAEPERARTSSSSSPTSRARTSC